MRRKDREVTDFGSMLKIVDACDCCRLGLIDEKGAYIVPLNFGYEADEERLVLYFHGAPAGKKYELVKKQHTASFEMDCKHELRETGEGCNYTYDFLSVMGNGEIRLVDEYEEKRHAFDLIFKHYTKRDNVPMNEVAVRAVAVFKLTVEEWSAKEHK